MATQRIITLPVGTIYRSTISRFPVSDSENVILNYDNNTKYLYMDGASSSSTIEGTVTFNSASSYALKMINSTDKIIEITPIVTMCIGGESSTYFNSEVIITLGNYNQKSIKIDSSFSKGVWKQVRLGPFTGSNLSLDALDGTMMTISIAAPQPIKVSQLCFEIKYETNSYLTTFSGQSGTSTAGRYPVSSSPLNIINDYGEHITPTGAAIIACFSEGLPEESFKIKNIGIGAGNREFENSTNILRVMEIESAKKKL